MGSCRADYRNWMARAARRLLNVRRALYMTKYNDSDPHPAEVFAQVFDWEGRSCFEFRYI
jgi:hypothetical protein